MDTNEWISIKDNMPEFEHGSDVRGGERTTATVIVKYNNGTTGIGHFRDNYFRSGWMTRQEGDPFLCNLAWSGLKVETLT
jgi:hypothetical protein